MDESTDQSAGIRVQTLDQTLEQTLDQTLARLELDSGFHIRLNDDHSVIHIRAQKAECHSGGNSDGQSDSATLLVSFVRAQDEDATLEDICPMGVHLRETRGWSHLCVIAKSDSWFRDPVLYETFDRLTDEGFFEEFDRVVFFGQRMGGYAAAAYSVASPGATVFACSPQATLTCSLAGWDGRYPETRRIDFTSRYGYAPEMAEAADQVFVVYDPYEPLDAMHAALFKSDHTELLPVRMQGPDTAVELEVAGALEEMVIAAAAGNLTRATFYQLFRRRRNVRRYLRRLLGQTEERERPYLTALASRTILSFMVGPQLREAYRLASQELESEGRSLPPMIEAPRKAAQG